MFVSPIRPRCMADDEWAGWCRANEFVKHARLEPADLPCRDCTVPFAVEMRTLGLCDYLPMSRGRRRSPPADQITEHRRLRWRQKQDRRRAMIAASADG